MTKTNGDSNTNNNDTSSKRSTMKSASTRMMPSMNSNNSSSLNNDNRIKFIDMLVCGSCQQDFQLSDIVKFIEHKAICGNKENKRKIPYFLSQGRRGDGDNDDEDDEDDDDGDDEEDKSQQSGNSSGNENERRIHQSQATSKKQSSHFPKVLVGANANTPQNPGT